MEPRKECPGTYHYPDLMQRIEPDKKDKKKSWLITYCAKCQFNYDIEEYKGKVKVVDIDMDGLPPKGYLPPPKGWPHI